MLVTRIAALRERVGGVRWVDSQTTHFTLHFFAELPAERVRAVVDAVGAVVADQDPFTLRLGSLGSFPGGARARVLWVGLAEESLVLGELALRVQAAVDGCGFDLDPRSFRPHVTVGRPQPGFDLVAWREAVAEPAGFPPFSADRVLLYESRNGHHVRERLPFGAASGRPGAPAETT